MQDLEKEIKLPKPDCTFADHSYPAYSKKIVAELIDRLQAAEKECVDHKKDAEMLAKRLEESANHVHAIESELKALREHKPVAYADPQAFINFDNATQNKEWMWCSPDAGLVAVYAAPVAQSRDSAEPNYGNLADTTDWFTDESKQICVIRKSIVDKLIAGEYYPQSKANDNAKHPLATVEAKQAVPDGWREIIEAVAHVGIDFGFGAYQLTDDHIANARILLAAAPQPEATCKMCNGHGMVGGWIGGTAEQGGGYESAECPDCNSSQPEGAEPDPSFQSRVKPWMTECFGEVIASDTVERNHRFLEEALELVQSCGCTQDEAHKLVDYTFSRDIGEKSQEVGGVMVTLAALCLANEIDMHESADIELGRVWKKIDLIRQKQLKKPSFSPLPGSYPEREQSPAPKAQDQK